MKINEIMTEDVEVIRPEMPVRQAAQKMAELNVGSIPVCDGSKLIGVVTDRDITIKATALGLNPEDVPVRDVMTAPIVYCYDDSDVEEAAELMEQNQIRRLPIISRESQQLVGIVALADLATKAHPKASGRALEGVSEQGFGERNLH